MKSPAGVSPVAIQPAPEANESFALPRCSMSQRGPCRPSAFCGRAEGDFAEEQTELPFDDGHLDTVFEGPDDDFAGHCEADGLNPCMLDGESGELGNGKSVPGSAASSIRIWESWKVWHSSIFAGRTPFSQYYKAQCRSWPAANSSAAHDRLWPMPLPYHGFLADHQLEPRRKGFKLLVNMQISLMNFIVAGERGKPPDEVCGPRNLSAAQWDVVARFERLSLAWRECEELLPADMGRTAAKQEQQEQMIMELTRLALTTVSELKKYQSPVRHSSGSQLFGNPGHDLDDAVVIGKTQNNNFCGARSIIASRIKMEGLPNYDPMPFLDDESGKLFCEPFHQGLAEHKDELCPPRVRVHASLSEKLALLRLLESTGRLQFRAQDEIHLGFGNGLFCVPKNLEVDKLILDGRPANCLQHVPSKFILTMASACNLLGIHLADDEKILFSGDDLSNFFYTFNVGYDRASRNFLDWAIPTELVQGFTCFPSRLAGEQCVFACLNTLAMGDSAACAYAQTSHLAMALQCGSLDEHCLVTMHNRIPRGRTVGGVIIDDYVVMEKVHISATSGADLVTRRSNMHTMYDRVKLDAHPSKGFDNVSHASFWGADFDGTTGLIRGTIARAISLCWITARVAMLGHCSIGLLEIIAGGFVALFCFRRRCMSLLQHIYNIQQGLSRDCVVALPQFLVDELWSLVLVAPLAVADLRAGFNDEVYMVDASSWGDAVVKGSLRGHMRAEVHRHGLNKSCWTRLLSPFKALLRSKGSLDPASELPCGEVFYSEHPIWECIARCVTYSLCWKKKAVRGRHINVGELRAYLRAERCAGELRQDVRIPIGGDSQVTCGAICKGRSASSALNRELRGSLPYMLGLGLYSCTGYVKSAHNPADDPTRGVPLRQPDCEFPNWWTNAELGDYEQLDELLNSCGLAEHQVAGHAPLTELNLKDPAVIEPTLKCSRSKKRRQQVLEKLVLRQKTKDESTFDDDAFTDHPCWSKAVLDAFQWFGKDQFILADGTSWPPDCPGFLDLYSGRKGFARSSVKLGAKWVLVVDFLDGPHCDLLQNKVRKHVWALLRGGAVQHFSAAPICASFSTAITPPIRSPAEPKGITPLRPSMREKILEGNSHSEFLASIVVYCILHGVLYWVENPDGSYIWKQPEWLDLPKGLSKKFYRVDYCSFKTPWRKRTRFLTSGRLGYTKRLCDRSHSHVLLRGRSAAHKCSMTKLAEPYPKGLCYILAWAACSDLGILKMKCSLPSRSKHRRIGEASNPGPRRHVHGERNADDLDNVQLVRQETVDIGKDAWTKFLLWVRDVFGEEIIQSLWKCPSLMGSMLAHYGRHAYESGRTLFSYRHLVVYAQRVHPGFRGHLQAAWSMINRWEELEPVEHRRPLPLRLVQAMVALSFCWGWHHVGVVIMMAFHGCCRPGEVLSALRCHVVLPSDIGEASGPCFLRILKPKPGRRGLGRVQHCKIRDKAVVMFLEKFFADKKPNARVYAGSAGAFRTRWNKLLTALGISTEFHLTPAGLRAGGCVNLYQQGLPIMDLLWCLRLRNLETLQHYLQEISTQITMIDLPQAAKMNVSCFANLFPCCLSTFQP